MDTTWIIAIAALSLLAIAATIGALVAPHAPRMPLDPTRFRRLSDRHEQGERDRVELRRAQAELEARIEHQLDAPGNGLAPQAGPPVRVGAHPRPRHA